MLSLKKNTHNSRNQKTYIQVWIILAVVNSCNNFTLFIYDSSILIPATYASKDNHENQMT